MARDYYDESKGKNPWSKKKKKNNQETSQKKTSSPSVSSKVSSSTYGGGTTGSNYATGIRRTTSSGGGSNSGRSTGSTSSSTPQTNAPQPTYSQRRYQKTGSNYGKSQRQMRSGGVIPEQQRRNEPVTSNRRNTPVTSTSRQRNGVATTSREMMEQRKAEQEAQRKSGSETRRSIAQAQKSGDYDRASKLHDEIYGPSERRSKVNEWDRDISDTITQTLKQVKASDIRYLNKSMQGITQKDAFLYTTEDQRKKADEKVARTEAKYSKQLNEANQALEDIKNKYGYLGQRGLEAVSSTTGLVVDLGVGALTGGASLFHMKMRSTGGTMGQVKQKADALRSQLKSTGYYTDEELDEMFKDVEARDLLNAEVNGDIEGISELFFRGFGPVAKYVGGSSIAEKIGSKLLNKAGGKTTSGVLKNALKGTAEEVAEEEMAGPAEAWASNLVYGNKFQGYQEDAIKRSLTDQSNALRSQIQSPEDAQSAAARLSSPAFKEESIESYMEAGHSREDATQLTEMSIEYLSAALSGDVDGMKIAQDAMVEKLAGGENDQREKFTLQDAIDSAVSTAMMTLPTGMPGAMTTQYMGNSYKENFGLNAVKQQTEIIRNWGDEQDRKKAEGIIESIDNGDDMSGTQVYEVIQKAAQYAIENKEADNTKMRTAEKKMADNDLRVAPIDPDGNLGPQTQQRYLKTISDTVSRYQALEKIGEVKGYSQADVLLGADIGASFNTGVLESEQVNDLVSGSETVKEVFRDVTGVDISQFDNNKQMLDSLMAAAADNLVNSARLEQVAWNDEVKGGVADSLSKGIGGEGDKAVSKILDSVDPRDRSNFLLTADVARGVYERARNTEESWDETRRRFKTMYPSANVDTMKDVYKAAKEDKAKAETYYYGKVVESGEKATRSSLNSAETGYVPGKFTDKRQNKEGKSLQEESLLKAIASAFGINIEVVDDLASVQMDKTGKPVVDENGNTVLRQDNGLYNSATNTLVLNAHPDATRSITQTMAHELTHHIAVHAPKEYVKLQKYIMDAWYRQDANRFNGAINSTKALYKAQKGQELTTEQALEELIANGAADFDWSDEQFISDVTVNEPSLAQAIINAIKDILRKIRSILSSGDVIDPASSEALYAKAIEFDKVKNMWVQAAQMARSDRAQKAIDEWQDRANQGSVAEPIEEKQSFSISEPVERVADLIAVHNLTASKLMGDFRLGGFPMPSIAVTNQNHENFGDISLLFHSDTIDPKKNRANKVYSADAWTPTVPQTDYEADHAVVNKAYNTVKDLVGEEPHFKQGISSYLHFQSVEEDLKRRGGFEGFIDFMSEKPFMKYAFLKSKGDNLEIPKKEVTEEKDWKESRVDLYKALLSQYGTDGIYDLLKTPMNDLYERDDVKAFIEEHIASQRPRPERANLRIFGQSLSEAIMYDMDETKTIGTKMVDDYSAAERELDRRLDQKEFRRWLENLFKGVIAQEGVYNGKDIFTPSGNRRSFAQTHYPANLEGILRVMKEQGEKNISNHTSAKTLRADLAKSFKSLAEIRDNEGKLKNLTEEEVEAIYDEIDSKFHSILRNIGEKSEREYDLFTADYIANVVSEIVQDNITSTDKIIKKFDEYGWKASEKDVQDIKDLLDAIESMPVNMFEAKPRRAVGFDEVKAAILPSELRYSDVYSEIRSGLESRGIPIYEYDYSKEGDRAEKVNQAATEGNLRFSINEESRVMYTPKGIEVVQNPTDTEYSSMRNAILSEYPWLRGTGEPLLRHTYDESGNEYYWNAFEGMHRDVEPYINRRYNTRTSQQWKWYEKPDKDDYPTDYSALMARYSIAEGLDEPYMQAVNSGNMDEAQRLVDEAAKMAGYTTKAYHGTLTDFTVFDENKDRGGNYWSKGFYFTSSRNEARDIYANEGSAENRSKISYGNESNIINAYLKMNNPYVVGGDNGVVYNNAKEMTPFIDALNKAMKMIYTESQLAEMDEEGSGISSTFDWMKDFYPDGFSAEEFRNDIVFELEMFGLDAPLVMNYAIREMGYDGIEATPESQLFNNSKYESSHYIVFSPEQIKSADTITYAEDGSVIPLSERFDPENNDIRYSLPTQDSDGNILTNGQMEYFKNSQARDEQGRLVPVYHTTNSGGFTVFDSSYSEDRRSIFFTNSLAVSKTYGTKDSSMTYECYLNLENPLIVDANYNAWDRIPMTRQVGNISLTEDYDTNEVSNIAFEEGHDGVIIKNCRDWAVDDSSDFDTTENSPYSTIYIAFSSNQIKDINNENPSENPDIRYSVATRDEVFGYLMQNVESITEIPLQNALLEDSRIRYSLDATNFENSIISEWDRRKRNLAEDVKDTPLRRSLINLMKQVRTDSGETRQYSTETIDETIRSLKKMYYYAKGNKAKDFAREAWDAAERIVGDINYNDVQYLHYKGISEYFANTEVYVPEELIDDDTFIRFAKDNAGRIRLFADKGIKIEEAWESLHDAYPDLFPRAAFVADSPVGMLIQMDWVLNQLEPYKEAYTSEEHSKLVEDLANTLCNIVEEGNEYNATVNDLNVRAMKQRHSEAMRKVREQEKKKRDNQKERAEKWKQKYLERVAKNKADKEAGRQKKNEAKLVGDIEKNIKWLSDRLRPETRTKDNAIPEQFRSALGALLAEFDLQSKGSKKIEKKKGYPSKTTIKLKQLREQYAAIAKENDDDGNNVFRYNGDLLVKMDELIKTMESLDKFFDKHYGREVTIADLSLSEMFIIDTMLKSLVHEFREYKNVTIESKRAEISGVSSEVIGDMDTQIGRHGTAREGGALGRINGLLNMSEVTPIYFFKRLGAMYKMYRELRKGFDKYIENDREVIKRLSEIMSGYYNKKNPGTTIESWRTMEDAQTFNFEYGPVTLSVAQMMEIYLYANRPQAFGHMIGDGIIVTPISPVGKIETAKEKLLGHNPMVDPVKLTYENVQEIISKLSEEQVNMANKLQELVAGYMSDLGNETTMKLYGYKMFDDPNYFGIHVSQTATNSSVDAPAITETIKNFGWTKPLTPGAKNTIVIGDIFTDVAKYCNEMNQFNAYAVPVSDFMRVYNYKLRDENGELKGSAKSAIIKAFGNQAHTYIMNFLRDLNGASMRRNGGLEGMIDSALGRAKKAAVFMNMRVALQQPTAIVRALAQINAKYFVGVRPSAEATKEMIEHCPIAQWKAWGFYDTHFGRDVEDLIMNKWSKADVVGSALYGALDNMTWGMIWQAVKKEVEAKQPALEKGSPAYWEACNRRASEVFDSTQVVDSPFHRSDAMRSKDTLVKQFTSFQAEPTLSFNVVRDFAVQAYDAVADGDKAKATKLIAKGVEIWTLQAAVVAVAQSLWDAVRHKDPDGDDDEDEGFFELWWQNFMADFADDMKFYNNIYFLKEFTPYAEKLVDYMKTGKWNTYDSNKLLMFQGAEKITQGLQQLIKKIQKGDDYKHKNGEPYTWYEVMTNFLGGVGYLTGMPIGTVMKDSQSILKWFNINVFATDGSDSTDEKKGNSIVDSIMLKLGYRKKDSDGESSGKSSESSDKEKSKEEKKAESKAVKKLLKSGLKQGEKAIPKTEEQLLSEIEEKTVGYFGEDRDRRIWDIVSDGYTDYIEKGDYGQINKIRRVVEKAGGNVQSFDSKVLKASKSAYKKMMVDDPTDAQKDAQINIRNYLLENGMTEAEISAEICYKSDTARDLKAAFRMGNEDYIVDELVTLLRAGITREDIYKLYKYRNYGAKDYDGKYSQPEYRTSSGTYIWPTQGTITSGFGYRDAPTAGASSYHQGIDIGAPQGTPVIACDGGVVVEAGANGGYGNSVGIRHDDGTISYYNHLYTWGVKVGDKVSQGQQIGQVGSTGISTGPHLDFRLYKDGEYLDPEEYLNKRT